MTVQVISIRGPRKFDARYTGPAAHQEALRDFKSYVSRKQWKTLIENVVGSGIYTPKTIRMMCGFTGVYGYPVAALIREYHPRFKRMFPNFDGSK